MSTSETPKFFRIRKDEGWFSATQTCDFFLKDPVLSFFRKRCRDCVKEYSTTKKNSEDFFMQQGIQFEEEILRLIREKLGKKSVVSVGLDISDVYSDRKALETFRLMKRGVPVIYSGIVQNPENKTFGKTDFLVRYDFLHRIIPSIEPLEKKFSPKLGKNWYYVVIDVKYSTLHLASDGIHLLNSDRFPAYKGQLLIYNLALAYMQGYDSGKAYLLGRKWVYTCKGVPFYGNHCLQRLGVIDYENYDVNYNDKLIEALNWLTLVDSDESATWNYQKYPLSHVNLYPNMNNRYDQPWHDLKNKIALDNGEITGLWYMGVRNRQISLDHDICTWKNKNCDVGTLGVAETNLSYILEQILDVNRSKRYKMLPLKLDDPGQEWLMNPKLEFYVDFETWNGSLACSNSFANTDNIIYMVGVLDNFGNYECFITDRISKENEKIILQNFSRYIRDTIARYELSENEVNCVHWSQFEPRIWRNKIREYRISDHINWFDLLDVFQGEPITIKNSLTFSLKDIARAMHGHGMICTTWDENMDGGDSSILAQIAEEKCRDDGNKLYETEELERIISYNRTDVVVLLEILDYLRRKYYQHRNKKRI